jgi:membrane-associated phospholipid phosphatase
MIMSCMSRSQVSLLSAGLGLVLAAPAFAVGSVDPGAGKWHTWVLSSPSQVRPAAPPDQAATEKELAQVRSEIAKRDDAALGRIIYWNAGWPGYRWHEIALERWSKEKMPTPAPTWLPRVMSLLTVAVDDATVAAWDAKYAYSRQRPSEVDPTIVTAIAVGAEPSYPSEHAAAATAAADVLRYLFPQDAGRFDALAEEAGRSRIMAGVAFPSDVAAGQTIGHQVAAAVIERAKGDGSDREWTGTPPTGPGFWTPGPKPPRLPMAGTYRTWVLTSPDQVRPGPPPAWDSPQKQAELAELKNFKQTEDTKYVAFYWDGPPQELFTLLPMAYQKIFEYRWDDDPPRAARAAALVMVASFDSLVACFDAKYHYWAARPIQLDPSIVPLFDAPNHPSYPSGGTCDGAAVTTVLAHLFPADAAYFHDKAVEMANSRVWGGVHFRSDVDAAMKLGQSVGELVVARARADGVVH